MKSRNLSVAFAAGHSLGEYSAHVAAGTFTFADAVQIVRTRGRLMQQAVPPGDGAMAAILGLGAARINDICARVRLDELLASSTRQALLTPPPRPRQRMDALTDPQQPASAAARGRDARQRCRCSSEFELA